MVIYKRWVLASSIKRNILDQQPPLILIISTHTQSTDALAEDTRRKESNPDNILGTGRVFGFGPIACTVAQQSRRVPAQGYDAHVVCFRIEGCCVPRRIWGTESISIDLAFLERVPLQCLHAGVAELYSYCQHKSPYNTIAATSPLDNIP